ELIGTRALDAIEVGAHFVAVPAEHVELVSDVGPGPKAAGIPVARDERERAPLTSSRDEDRWTRPLQALRHVQQSVGRDMMPRVRRVGPVFALPHPHAHLESVLEEVEARRDVGKGKAEAFALLLVVARTDAEPRPAT